VTEEGPTEEAEDREAALEKARVLFAQACTFIASAPTLESIPDGTLPEVAFVGRSNVGKSRLVNALTGRTTLARVSNTPGRTRALNFFDLGGRLMLADLPGYGFAKVSKTESQQWNELILAYLRGRPLLRRAVLLIDARRGLMPADVEVMSLMDRAALSYQIVLTKADKLSATELTKVHKAVHDGSLRHPAAHPEILVTSSQTGQGIPELRAALAEFAE
jgi:GTP-binding protein